MTNMHPSTCLPLLVLIGVMLTGCDAPAESKSDHCRLEVTATAYNSSPEQTDGQPDLAAWGDRLKPDTRAIAVSPDLIKRGLDHNTPVWIEGLSGTYRVLDRMPSRWQRKIDIYMGNNQEAAQDWGRRKVAIEWPGC